MHFVKDTDFIVGVILAGGKSSRMGQNKALLNFRGKTLLEHNLSLMQHTKVHQTAISGAIEKLLTIADCVEARGPLGGMFSVFESDSLELADFFLFIPVDMPLLTPSLLNNLIEQIGGESACCYENHSLPLLLRRTDEIHELLRSKLSAENSRCSIKSLLASVDTKTVSIPSAKMSCFTNVNNPKQWESLEKITVVVTE